jgi:hypothetical protein
VSERVRAFRFGRLDYACIGYIHFSSNGCVMNLLWLGDPKSFDVALVGGKEAEVRLLARMVHRLPDGVIVRRVA